MIGDVEIIQIVEMVDNQVFSTFIPEAKPERVLVIEWLKPHFVGEKGNLRAQVQSFLIRSNGKNILIDTCNGNDKERPNVPTWGNLQTNYLEKFKAVGILPEEIDIVACTHLHFDHVGWNTKRDNGIWIPTFHRVKYLFSKKEYEYWIKKPEKEMVDDFNGIDDSVTPIIEAGLAELVSDDHLIDQYIRLIPTPGHTPHHVSIMIESRGKRAIISGDTLHHPCQIAFQGWTTLADTFPDQTVVTRRKLLAEIKDTDTLLVGSHFANPVAGKVKTLSAGLIFEIH